MFYAFYVDTVSLNRCATGHVELLPLSIYNKEFTCTCDHQFQRLEPSYTETLHEHASLLVDVPNEF